MTNKDKKTLRLWDPKKKKIINAGYIEGDTFYKEVKSNHYMGIYEGYGIQESIFNRILDDVDGVKWVVIKKKSGENLKSTIEDWIKEGVLGNHGHGKQRFLNEKFYKKYEPKTT